MGSYNGRHTVIMPNGRRFVVEPISKYANRDTVIWDNGLKKEDMPKGGAVHPDDSIITEENGFKNIVLLGPGESPYSAINEIYRNEN